MIEIVFKIIVTMIIIFALYLVLSWLWTHQIDVKETILGPFKKKVDKPVDWIATRNPKSIYQNDKIVGDITGAVVEKDGQIIFYEICNTSDFNRDMPFEYKRDKLKVINIGTIIGMDISGSERGTEVKSNVLEDIICERVK